MKSEVKKSVNGSAGRVLVCSTDADVWRATIDGASHFRIDIQVIGTVDAALELLEEQAFDAYLLDARETQSRLARSAFSRQGRTVTEIASSLWRKKLTTRLILLVPEISVSPSGANIDSRSTYVSQMYDVVQQPYTTASLGRALFSAVQYSQLFSENRRLKSQLRSRTPRRLLGKSPEVERLRARIAQATNTDENIMICGEAGTGTSLVAQAIYDGSQQARGPFGKVNCRRLSAAGFERELFGCRTHNSDSLIANPGRLLLASGGTLFLDEVDAIAMPMQRRLFRALDKQAGRSACNEQFDHQNVRVLAATHVDLKERVRKKHFRDDLYELLNGFTIRIPPLRQCPKDIAVLAEHFLAEQTVKEEQPSKHITLEGLRLLKLHNWPGNVRELQIVIENTCLLDCGPALTAEMLRPWLANDIGCERSIPRGLTLREMERKLIEATFTRYGGSRERTAQSLNIGLRTLSGKLREYGYPPRGGPGSNLRAA